ncbi:hypothetical protein BaRGS_00008883, partial [Batillaria attramentaria]
TRSWSPYEIRIAVPLRADLLSPLRQQGALILQLIVDPDIIRRKRKRLRLPV